MTDQRDQLLRAALGFSSSQSAPLRLRPFMPAARGWIRGPRQGYDLQLTRYGERGWRATFYTTGMEHSITSATASAWERSGRRGMRRSGRRGRR